MESRTHLLVVGQFSTASGPMGVSYSDVSSLCQCRLSGDRTQTVMKPLLSRIESDAEPAFCKSIEAVRMNHFPRLSPEDRAACKRFFIHMVLRNPKHAQQIFRVLGVDDATYEACWRLRIELSQGIPVPATHMLDSDPGVGFPSAKADAQHVTGRARIAAGRSFQRYAH